MKKITPKEFINLLSDAVEKNIITSDDKERIETECAYTQYEMPAKLEGKMMEYLRNLKLIQDENNK